METTRQQKISRLIQKEMADLLQKDRSFYQNRGMLTVTGVKVSSDLSYARIYVSVFGVESKPSVIQSLTESQKEIRYRLGQRLRNQLRVIPELLFVQDDTLDYIEKIDNLLKQ